VRAPRRNLLNPPPPPDPGGETRSLRLATRALLGLALVAFGFVVAGLRNTIPRETVPSSLAMFAGCLLASGWIGLRAHRHAVADRERQSHGAMVVAIATQLGQQDDETLTRIVSRGGPTAEAAAMILAARRNPRKSSALPSSWT
jgi:hypothetical protein